MSVAPHISFATYTQMVSAGAFEPLRDRRIELIAGELREQNPSEPAQSEAVSRISQWSILKSPRNAITVRIHDPIGIPELDSAPQPDIAWVLPRNYTDRHPQPDEVLLVIEVADSSLDYDLGEKAELYAAAGIQDYWVVDLRGRVVHIFRRPSAAGFQERSTARFGDELRPLKFPAVSLDVSALLSM